jgi:hypothetical protein
MIIFQITKIMEPHKKALTMKHHITKPPLKLLIFQMLKSIMKKGKTITTMEQVLEKPTMDPLDERNQKSSQIQLNFVSIQTNAVSFPQTVTPPSSTSYRVQMRISLFGKIKTSASLSQHKIRRGDGVPSCVNVDAITKIRK